MKQHKVKQGESIKSIANRNGFYWETIWNDPANQALKTLRGNPDILQPGDIIVIPDIQPKKADLKANSLNTITVKGHREKFRVQLVSGGIPRSSTNYTLTVDKKFYSGTTDGQGWVEKMVPRKSKVAHLFLGDEEDENGNPLVQEEYIFDLRHLDPIETLSGVQQRLNNLGYDCGDEEEAGKKTVEAIMQFQSDNGLFATGILDEGTRLALKSIYKC